MSGEAARLRLVEAAGAGTYRLDDQVGFLLRRASQRHLAIFAQRIPDLTPPQWAVLVTLAQGGETAQNRLGQAVAMDAATVKGVIDRLKARGLVALAGDEADRRRVMVGLTEAGRALVDTLVPAAQAITAETLEKLSEREAETLKKLLAKLD